MNRVVNLFRRFRFLRPKFRFRISREREHKKPVLRSIVCNKSLSAIPAEIISRSVCMSDDDEDDDVEDDHDDGNHVKIDQLAEIKSSPHQVMNLSQLDISPSSDERSYYCYTTEDDDNEEDDASKISIRLEDLPVEVQTLRREILEVLVRHKILSLFEARLVNDNPRCWTVQNRLHLLNNYLWLPEDLLLGTCFVDFINYYCDDADYLDELLISPISVSHNDASNFSKTGKCTIVKDLLHEHEGKFYSFCLSRAVFVEDTNHCPRCHACFDYRYWHCNRCNRCSFGMSIGACEHCGYRDVFDNTSGNQDDDSMEEISVHSVSQLE